MDGLNALRSAPDPPSTSTTLRKRHTAPVRSQLAGAGGEPAGAIQRQQQDFPNSYKSRALWIARIASCDTAAGSSISHMCMTDAGNTRISLLFAANHQNTSTCYAICNDATALPAPAVSRVVTAGRSIHSIGCKRTSHMS